MHSPPLPVSADPQRMVPIGPSPAGDSGAAPQPAPRVPTVAALQQAASLHQQAVPATGGAPAPSPPPREQGQQPGGWGSSGNLDPQPTSSSHFMFGINQATVSMQRAALPGTGSALQQLLGAQARLQPPSPKQSAAPQQPPAPQHVPTTNDILASAAAAANAMAASAPQQQARTALPSVSEITPLPPLAAVHHDIDMPQYVCNEGANHMSSSLLHSLRVREREVSDAEVIASLRARLQALESTLMPNMPVSTHVPHMCEHSLALAHQSAPLAMPPQGVSATFNAPALHVHPSLGCGAHPAEGSVPGANYLSVVTSGHQPYVETPAAQQARLLDEQRSAIPLLHAAQQRLHVAEEQLAYHQAMEAGMHKNQGGSQTFQHEYQPQAFVFQQGVATPVYQPIAFATPTFPVHTTRTSSSLNGLKPPEKVTATILNSMKQNPAILDFWLQTMTNYFKGNPHLIFHESILGHFDPNSGAWLIPFFFTNVDGNRTLRSPIPDMAAFATALSVRVMGQVRPTSVTALEQLLRGEIVQGKGTLQQYIDRFRTIERQLPNESPLSMCKHFISGVGAYLKGEICLDASNLDWSNLDQLITYAIAKDYRLSQGKSSTPHSSVTPPNWSTTPGLPSQKKQKIDNRPAYPTNGPSASFFRHHGAAAGQPPPPPSFPSNGYPHQGGSSLLAVSAPTFHPNKGKAAGAPPPPRYFAASSAQPSHVKPVIQMAAIHKGKPLAEILKLARMPNPGFPHNGLPEIIDLTARGYRLEHFPGARDILQSLGLCTYCHCQQHFDPQGQLSDKRHCPELAQHLAQQKAAQGRGHKRSYQ